MTDFKGYMGKVLFVDLTKQTFSEFPWTDEDRQRTLGGKVMAADYSPTMGNYIMIDHGDDLITIYMHCSSLGVSKGQEVSKGDRIASVGSTGRSTGPHLHFGVRQSGSYVSPWKYLK